MQVDDVRPRDARRASPAATGEHPATAEEAVMTAMVTVGRRMRQRFPGDELDFAALPLLKALLHGGPSRITALAADLGLDASTVSRHARHLEDRGLLERTEDPADGRASRVMLSERGRGCLERGAKARRELIGRALSDWSDADRELLRRLLVRLHTDLTATEPPEETA